MLTAIQGIYENSQIMLDELPPTQKRTKVVVTFLDGEDWIADDTHTSSEVTQLQNSTRGVRLGSREGKYSLPDDFNDPLDDLADYM